MNKQAGVWIDHSEAILIFLGEDGERTERMASGVERHARIAGLSSEDASPDDQHDRQVAGHLDKYYDEVMRQLGTTEAILLFGPGEAKGEFQKRMESKGHAERIVCVLAADKMTDPQIAAKVRDYFRK
ncbi:MAG: hypothetical protein ABI672_16955 [Vicinamibacteria bacterium]